MNTNAEAPPRLKLEGIFPNDSIRVHSLMIFPNDERLRRAFYAVEYVRCYELDLGDGDVFVRRNLIADLLEAPSWPEFKTLIKDQTKEGIVAGWVVAFLFVMNRHPELLPKRAKSGASLNKAFAAIDWIARNTSAYQFGDGSPLPKKSSIKSAWEKFRPVAHLLAAATWIKPFREARGGSARPDSQDQLHELVCAAHYFRRFGESFVLDNRSGNARETLLPTATTWRVGEDAHKARMQIPDDPAVFKDSPFMEALRHFKSKN